MNRHRDFFLASQDAHYTAFFIYLAKIFDKRSDSSSLATYLELICNHIEPTQFQVIETRYKELARRATPLITVRHKTVAHVDAFSHFAIIDERQTTDQVVITTPTEYHTSGSATSYGNSANFSATTTTSGGNSYIIKKPSSSNTIVCFNGKPNNGVFVYDAQFIYNGLTSKYKINSN